MLLMSVCCQQQKPSGFLFLHRKNATWFLTLCVCVRAVRSSKRVKHFKVVQMDENHFQVERNHHFSSLIDLVEHYCANSLNNGSALGRPCRRVRPALPSPIAASSFLWLETGTVDNHRWCKPIITQIQTSLAYNVFLFVDEL